MLNVKRLLPDSAATTLMVDITDEHSPQGWFWGEGSPGLLPGLCFAVPMERIGQHLDSTLAFQLVDEENVADYALVLQVVATLMKRLKKRQKAMWALDRVEQELHLSIYLPNDDAVDVFERSLSKISGWDASRVCRRSRLFL